MLHKHAIAPDVTHCCETHIPKLTATKVTNSSSILLKSVGREFQQDSTGCGGMFLFSNVWTSSRKTGVSASNSAGRKSTSGTRVPELASLQLVSGKPTYPSLVLSYRDNRALYVMDKAPQMT